MGQHKDYIRDGRSPIPSNKVTSKVMSAIRGKNTKPEIILRKTMWHSGLKGYRLHWKKAPGRPDIAFPGKKVAIFVNGCFWHRCPHCSLPLPKSNRNFWKQKFEKNVERDKRKIENLKSLGWTIFVIWECEIKNDLTAIVRTASALTEKQ